MSGFLNYLEDFNVSTPKKQPKKETKKKKKVLCLNVEVRTVEGAQIVIEKLQDWISKQENSSRKTTRSSIVEKRNKPYRIPPKKVIRNKVQESTSHAVNILDGLSDDQPVSPNSQLSQMNGNMLNINSQPNIDTVAGHASALL